MSERFHTQIPDPKYYELHITIESVYDEKLSAFQILCEKFHFKIADFLLWKERPSTERRGNLDAFCTGRAKTYEEGHEKLFGLSQALIDAGIEIWRQKIEAVLFDQRLKPAQPSPWNQKCFHAVPYGLGKSSSL